MTPSSAFDLASGAVLLRLLCGAFFVPHVYFKIAGNPPPALGFFVQAGFRPPALFMWIAAVVETFAAAGMLLGVYTQWAALLGAASLSVAAAAVCAFNRGYRWLWNLNGIEYCVFWAGACVVVAMLHWS